MLFATVHIDMRTPAQHTIIKLRIIAGCTGTLLYAAFDKLFFQERGLSLAQVVALEVIIGTIVILTEVPSGALSDRWSRKYVLCLSVIFLALATILWAISQSFWLFAIGAIFGGLSLTFKSGTNTSLLYDSLRAEGREKTYARQLGMVRTVAALSYITAAIVGGWLGQSYGLDFTFWATLPLLGAALITALTLHEPHFHRSTGEASYWRHIGSTAGFLSKKPCLLRLASLIIAVTIPMLLIDKYAQVYFAFVGVGFFGIGLLASLSGGIDALCNSLAHRITQVRRNVLFGGGLIAMSVAFLAAGLAPNVIGVSALLVASAIFFIIAIIAEADLNHQLPSNIRATSESFFSLSETLISLPISFLFAWLGQQYSIATAFAAVGGLLGCYAIYFLLSQQDLRYSNSDLHLHE